MKFGRMLKYDLRYGTVRRFGYYLLPLLLGVADAVRQVLNYYKVRNPGTLLDHWLIMTAGTSLISQIQCIHTSFRRYG